MVELAHSVRYIEKKDLEQFVVLCQQHAVHENAPYDRTNKVEILRKSIFEEHEVLKCIVVEIEKNLVSYTTFMKQYSTWDGSYYVYMDCLFLNSKAQNRGIGKELMNEIERYAITENCKQIQWQTPKDNSLAMRFYHRLGATSKEKERFFLNLK